MLTHSAPKLVRDSGGIQITAKGKLPRSFVCEMVDVFLLHGARIVCKLCGLIGFRKNQFTLRKKARPLLEPESAGLLRRALFLTFFLKYNIGYLYRGIDLDWVEHEIGYLLKPLQLNADAWIEICAITPKLFHPMKLERLEHELQMVKYIDVTYVLSRYFLRSLSHWGLLEIKREKKGCIDVIRRLRKTLLFDQFIRFDF